MKLHALLVLLRVLLALGVALVLPLAHAVWGQAYPGDGQRASGMMMVFLAIGLVAAVVFMGVGSLCQFLLRRRPSRWTVLTDLGWFVVLCAVLAYGGVTARYAGSQAGQAASIQR